MPIEIRAGDWVKCPGKGKEHKMERYLVMRTNRGPLEFEGERLASAETSMNDAARNYSGNPGESQAVAVFRIATGRYIVAICHYTCLANEHDRYEAVVLENLPQVVNNLREHVPNWVVDDLIKQLGPEAVAEKVS